MNMSLKDNINRFIHAIGNGSRYDIDDIKDFVINTREEEVRSNSEDFIKLCHRLTDDLVERNRSIGGISIISTAITKLQQHKMELTPLHSDFCKLCLDAKCYNPALELLETYYTEIRKSELRVDNVKRVLLFYYYGGLLCAAMKKFERAAYYFETVITVPANVVTPITQAAYKKLILINVLLNGKLPDQPPKSTPICVLRQLKQTGHVYLKFAQEYSSLSMERILQYVTTTSVANTFEQDENMGLVKQCIGQMQRRYILRLAKAFSTLPIRDVAKHVGLHSDSEAELFLLNMINDGEISATINQRDGMVVFYDDTEKYDSAKVFQELQEDISRTTSLINTFKRMDKIEDV